MAAASMSAPTPLLDVSIVSPLKGQRNRRGDYAQSSCPMTDLPTPRQHRQAQPSQKRPIDETFQVLPFVGSQSLPIPSRKLVSKSKSHDCLAFRGFVRRAPAESRSTRRRVRQDVLAHSGPTTPKHGARDWALRSIRPTRAADRKSSAGRVRCSAWFGGRFDYRHQAWLLPGPGMARINRATCSGSSSWTKCRAPGIRNSSDSGRNSWNVRATPLFRE